MACTLPVTLTTAERSFSKLKLIKTYLRSSMGQDRLSELAIKQNQSGDRQAAIVRQHYRRLCASQHVHNSTVQVYIRISHTQINHSSLTFGPSQNMHCPKVYNLPTVRLCWFASPDRCPYSTCPLLHAIKVGLGIMANFLNRFDFDS
jgi:hypothetical protein